MNNNIAIAHDQLRAHGGAEEVAFEMARTFDAPIYAAAVDDSVIPDDVTAIEITDQRLGKWAMDSHYMIQDLYQMIRWQHVEELYDYDVVIENKTNPWWFVPKDEQTIVRYCHSTPRGLFDQFHRQGGGLVPRVVKMGMRDLFSQTIPYADAWATNSELVQRRLDGYIDIPNERVDVIHPPVETASYSPDDGEDEDYYFTFSRLRDHKRINDIVAAINQLNRRERTYRLVVGGKGPEREALEEQAGDHIEFVGYMDETEKRRRLAECKAFIFAAKNEDFGLVPIEAMAAGTPVIGVKEGFTKHQIIPEKNGLLWPRAGEHLREAIRRFERGGVEWEAEQIQLFADQFNADRFREELREFVADAVKETRVTTTWDEPLTEPQRTHVAPDGGEIDG